MPLHDCSSKEGLFQLYLLLEEVLLEVHRKNPPVALFLPVNQNITEYTCRARNTIKIKQLKTAESDRRGLYYMTFK